MPSQLALPPTLRPRLVGRETAAAYACVSPNTFDEMVKDGRMPGPRVLTGKRIAWDLLEIDRSIDALPHRDEEPVLVGKDVGWEDGHAA
jgi:predicted DNA-binding transcriptional regulator AlpA